MIYYTRKFVNEGQASMLSLIIKSRNVIAAFRVALNLAVLFYVRLLQKFNKCQQGDRPRTKPRENYEVSLCLIVKMKQLKSHSHNVADFKRLVKTVKCLKIYSRQK
jgi:hypothetical protein